MAWDNALPGKNMENPWGNAGQKVDHRWVTPWVNNGKVQ